MTVVERAAHVLIRRQTDGKYLLLTCSLWPENPGRSQKPDLPGGVVEPYEQIEDGLLREVQEETGLDLLRDSLQLGRCFTYFDGDVSSNFLVYVAEVTGDQEVVLSWEHESYQWLSAAELPALDIRRPYEEIFAYMATIGLVV